MRIARIAQIAILVLAAGNETETGLAMSDDDGRTDDEPTSSGPSRPDEKPFRPVSQMTPREWASAAAEVQRRWPRQNRFQW
jgi:hypothetical protein